MRLGNLFTLRLSIDQAWEALLDIERLALCVPGARLVEGVDGEYHGVVKVQVGAAAAEYDGWLRFTDVDEAARRIVVHAVGTESRDGSQAAAWVTASLTSAGDATSVTVETELTVSGKLGRFGAGVMTDAAAALLKQFAQRLEEAPAPPETRRPSAPTPAPGAPAPPDPSLPQTVRGKSRRFPVGFASNHPAAGPWLPAGLIGVMGAMAVAPNRRWRWALAAVGAGLVLAGQRRSSST